MFHFENRRLVRFLAILFIGVAATIGPGNAATVIALDDTNINLIQGRWEGTYSRFNARGDVLWEEPVTLQTSNDVLDQSIFKFENRQLPTPSVHLLDGKIVIYILSMSPMRHDFVLERMGNGKLRLKSKIYSKVRSRWNDVGYLDIVVVLEKTSDEVSVAMARDGDAAPGTAGQASLGDSADGPAPAPLALAAAPPAVSDPQPVAAAPSASAAVVPQDLTPPDLTVPETVATDESVVEIVGAARDDSRIVEVTVEGRPVAVAADGAFTVRRGVPQGISTIVIAALDEWGNQATRNVTVMRRAAAIPTAALATPAVKERPFADVDFGGYYALVIGNNDYAHLPNLESAVADAEAVARLLEADYGFETTLLINATRGDVIGALAAQRARRHVNDSLLVYYAGHGVVDTIADEGYWLPVDAEERVPTNWVSNDDVTNMLRAIRARHVMVVADSCYSGTLVRAAPAKLETAAERTAWIKRMLRKRSRTALVSGGLEPVVDSGGGGHSVFAKAFLDALGENDGVLDGQGLFDALKRPVVLNADQTPQYADVRRAGHEGGEFLFVRR